MWRCGEGQGGGETQGDEGCGRDLGEETIRVTKRRWKRNFKKGWEGLRKRRRGFRWNRGKKGKRNTLIGKVDVFF